MKFAGVAAVAMMALAASTRAAQVESDGQLVVEDGTVLEHSLVLPEPSNSSVAVPERFPLLLVRTAYDRRSLLGVARDQARRGVAVMIQDCRGTGSSGGRFVPFVNEASDGAATLDWIGDQPWCDGRIATTGMSYLGITQHFLLSAPRPPRAMVLQFTSGDVYHDLIHYGGGQSLAIALHWALMMNGTPQLPRFSHLPLREADDASGSDVSYWNDWTDHPSFDEYWQRLDVRSKQREYRGAVLSIGGWYDLFLPGQVSDFQRFAAREGPVEERFARLILGPWDHGGPGPAPARPDLGPEAYGSTSSEEAEFLARFHRDEANGYEAKTGVRAFFLGENRWHELDRWPPSAAEPVRFHLRGLGHAAAEISDGLLLPAAAHREEPADAYVYDPQRPTPSFATSLWTPLSSLADLAEIGRRSDVLQFATLPLAEERRFAGDLRARLWVRLDVPDADFCLRVVALSPDGPAEWRGEGTLRGRYRDSFEVPNLFTPGVATPVEVELGPMAFVLPAGHRLGLQIASANFPRFARNLDLAGDPGTQTGGVPARVEILHDPEHDSWLELSELRDPPAPVSDPGHRPEN